MKPFPVDSFHGGMIDEFDSAPSHYAQRMRNFMLDATGKMYERPGTTLWSSLQTPTAERISNLKIFRDLTRREQASTRLTAFAYSNQKIWASTGGGVSATTGPVAWTEVRSQGSDLNPAAYNASILTRAKFQLFNQHIYASFNLRSNESSSDAKWPSIKRIYPGDTGNTGPNNLVADSWLLADIGLPTMGIPGVSTASGTITHAFSTPGAPVADNDYIYYFVYRHRYFIDGIEFATQGAPSAGYVINNAPDTPKAGGSPFSIDFSGLQWPVNTGNNKNCYPLISNSGVQDPKMLIDVYRTAKQETVPRFVGSVNYPATTFSDNKTDEALGAVLYTADGSAPYNEPPQAKLFHVVNETGYYARFGAIGPSADQPNYLVARPRPNENKIIQSVPAVIGSAPLDFEINCPDVPVGFDSIDYHPIVFFRNSCWRIEGQIDAYGNGSPVLRPISETVGLLHSNGIIKMDRGLIFLSTDGAYFTDGFSVKLITEHAGKFWAKLWNFQSATEINQMSSAFDPSSKKFFFSHRSAQRAASVTTMANTLVCGDLGHQSESGDVAVSEHCSIDPANGTQYPLLVSSMEILDGAVLMGDLNGYIQKMEIEAQPGVGTNSGTDIQTHASNSTSTFQGIPVVPEYISAALDLGNNIFKKWATSLILRFKMPLSQTKIFAQVTSYNEDSYYEDVSGDSAPNGKTLKEVRETAIPAYRRVYTVVRKFAKSQIRCLYKQIRITKSFTVLYASIPAGTRAYAKVVTSAVGNTAQLQSGTWPTDIVGQSLYLSDDSYVRSWAILTVSGDTITVYDPLNNFPENGAIVAREWMIKGYPKDVKLGVHGYSVLSTDIQGVHDTYQTSDSGGQLSYNPDAVLKTNGVVDEIVRDNLLKLNRVFNKEMKLDIGQLSLRLDNMESGGTSFKLNYQKVGRVVTLTFDSDVSGTKFGTGLPQLAGSIPEFLRPKASRLLFLISVTNAGSFQAANMSITSDGSIFFDKPTAWTASATVIYATSVSYVGN